MSKYQCAETATSESSKFEPLPSKAARVSLKSPVEMLFRYSHGSNSSICWVRLRYRGNRKEVRKVSFGRTDKVVAEKIGELVD